MNSTLLSASARHFAPTRPPSSSDFKSIAKLLVTLFHPIAFASNDGGEYSQMVRSRLWRKVLYKDSRRRESRFENFTGANMKEIRISRAILPAITAAVVSLCGFATCAASSVDKQKLASANAGFAFKLLKQLAKEQPNSNIFISPFGASTVLQMACNGAKGQTKAEMQQALGSTALSQDALNKAEGELNKSLNNRDTNNILTVANAIWCQKGIPVLPGFLSCNRQFFGATVEAVDFNDPRSVDVINAWASEKTRGRITRIADGLNRSDMDLFLANAMYFKGKWLEPFENKYTKDRTFYLRSGGQKKVPMMEQTRRFTYRRGTGYQAVRLPYQGWSLAMYVFLPDADSSPDKLLAIMSGDTWDRITKPGFEDRDGTVVLPKFKLEYGVELKQTLKAMGMKVAFDPTGKADLSGMASRPLFISAVRQQTFVEVNEEGTEAAAVTGIPVPESSSMMEPPKPFQMIIVLPFLFLIEDTETNTILFMGVIFNPGATS